MYFMYRVPQDASVSENERLTKAMQTLKRIEPQIPVYHTRAMRKQFQKEVSFLHGADFKPHILRHIYRTLTSDCSAEVECFEIDERVKTAILMEDEDLVLDLRHLNKGRPADTFKVFFEALEKLVDEITAADDRQHGVAHMSEFLSIPDLIRQVKEKLPVGTPVPSETTVLYAFAPPNTHAASAQYYTGKINLKHTIQRRQLRAYHTDAHWCNALFKYVREMAVLFKNHALFLSCDDKSKIDYGEPGTPLSTGVRGKKSIVPVSSILAALDHDTAQKGSLTPYVSMLCNIPDETSESFYRGNVSVCLKDSVFQPSNSFRSVLEILKSVKAQKTPEELEAVRIVFMMTDGGPEHRVNFDSVKIPLILLFRELKVSGCSSHCYKHVHSFVNIVERIMSILNIGFQNIALQRESSPSDEIINKCNNLADLRKRPEIKEDWQQSVHPMVKLRTRGEDKAVVTERKSLCGIIS